MAVCGFLYIVFTCVSCMFARLKVSESEPDKKIIVKGTVRLGCNVLIEILLYRSMM